MSVPALKLNDGFTLIEMSIVLVIIGLIVGGILVAESLFSASEVRAQITQIEKLNQAVNTFRDKYGGLPGDLPSPQAGNFGFNIYGCDGTPAHRDGNGLLDGWAGGSQGFEQYNTTGPLFTYDQPIGETGVFWQDLSDARLIDGTYPNGGVAKNGCDNSATPITSQTAGSYFPPAKIGRGNFLYVYELGGYNWYGVSAIISADGTQSLYSNPTIPVKQAYSIDAKIDDGKPLTGNVRPVYINGADGNVPPVMAPNAASDSATTCYNTSGPAYSIAYNGGSNANCALSFRFQ